MAARHQEAGGVGCVGVIRPLFLELENHKHIHP